MSRWEPPPIQVRGLRPPGWPGPIDTVRLSEVAMASSREGRAWRWRPPTGAS